MKNNAILQFSFFSKLNSFVDRVYYSFPLEFWLFLVVVGTIVNLVCNHESGSISIALAMSVVLGIYLVQSNRFADKVWNKTCQGIKLSSKSLPLFTAFTGLGSIFWITTVVETAHALIITASGETAIRSMLSGTAFGAAAATTSTTGTGGAVTTTGSGTGGLVGYANTIITLIKVIFALAFVFALYGSYQKYTERAELQEIVQAPVILLIVVLAIDGILAILLGST